MFSIQRRMRACGQMAMQYIRLREAYLDLLNLVISYSFDRYESLSNHHCTRKMIIVFHSLLRAQISVSVRISVTITAALREYRVR